MKILYNNTLSTNRLPKSRTQIFDSHKSPSKSNIKLKTHSLTCLDIPLDTVVGFNSVQSNHQRTMVGSVDLISEIKQQRWNDKNIYPFSSSKPLIRGVSSNEQISSVTQDWRQVLKHKFQRSNSFITPTPLHNSIARLRRSGHLQNIHQTSLQTIDKIPERKRRLSLIHNGPIPKFTFRDLPSINQSELSFKSTRSPFTSLPEIRSFAEQNINKPNLSPTTESSGWKKSKSWSWKSNNPIQCQQTVSNEIERQIDNRSHLTVIIESPLQQRATLQAINQNSRHSSTKLSNIHRSNLSFRSDKIQLISHRFYQKKNSFPHSISNYEVSPNQFSSRPSTRYPSTPLLAYPCHKNLDYHPFHLDMTPIATFDDDDDDDSDSISSNSSFRSCLNSVTELSENNTTELSSSLSESCFQEISSIYDLNPGVLVNTMKHTRLSFRHFCIVQ